MIPNYILTINLEGRRNYKASAQLYLGNLDWDISTAAKP